MHQSFLPHSIREWNELEDEVKEATTIAIFKGITKHKPRPNRVYNLEYTRASAIEMTRLRCENGNLKENLHSRSLALSLLCESGETESDYHYFITCPLYDNAHCKGETLVGPFGQHQCTSLLSLYPINLSKSINLHLQ